MQENPFSLKVLRVSFDATLRQYELPAFRGAVIAKVGHQDTLLFHHHYDARRYHYQYPLIQYKLIRQQPGLLCLHRGVEESHKLFAQPDWTLQIGERELPMRIARLELNQFRMVAGSQLHSYQIRQWIALDQRSYKEYQTTNGLTERIRLLESKLVGNVISFAKGIGWTLPDKDVQPVLCHIDEMLPTSTVRLKGLNMMGFNLHFRTNVFLPDYIGLGNNASLGFGVVSRPRPTR